MTEGLANLLHAEVGPLKSPARLVGPASVAQELPERKLGSPVLDGISDRGCQLQRRAQMSFGAIPIPLSALELAGQAPALYQVLAGAGAGGQIETLGAVSTGGRKISTCQRQLAHAGKHPDRVTESHPLASGWILSGAERA